MSAVDDDENAALYCPRLFDCAEDATLVARRWGHDFLMR